MSAVELDRSGQEALRGDEASTSEVGASGVSPGNPARSEAKPCYEH